jgi:AmiR/NasT family two-component response regulator
VSTELMAAAGAVDDAQERIRQLEEALRTRTVIARAQGMIMERYGVGAEEAFAVLRRLSNESNIPVRELARQVVETRRLPD